MDNTDTFDDNLTIQRELAVIPTGKLEACFTILAMDHEDGVLKSDRYFTLKVETVNPLDTIRGNRRVVIIVTDNNCKYSSVIERCQTKNKGFSKYN